MDDLNIVHAENVFPQNDPDDDRETKPADVLDCLAGYIERGEVQDILCIVELKDTSIQYWMSDLVNTAVLGLLEAAKQDYALRWLRGDFEPSEGGE